MYLAFLIIYDLLFYGCDLDTESGFLVMSFLFKFQSSSLFDWKRVLYIYKVDIEMFYSILTKIFQYQLYVYIHNTLVHQTVNKVETFNQNGRTKKPLWRSKSQLHSTR
jgi:hypothetical protein